MNETLAETLTHEGVKIELHYDWDAGDPFQDFDQAAALVGFSRFARDFETELTLDEDRFVSVAHAARYLTLARGYLVAIPFRFTDYGSGGYRATLTDTDDDRAAGFVVVSQAGGDLTGCPDPEEAARQDFETWRQWIEGEVFGYVVAPGTLDEDSLWGIYGHTTALEEAEEAASYVAARRRETAAEIATHFLTGVS